MRIFYRDSCSQPSRRIDASASSVIEALAALALLLLLALSFTQVLGMYRIAQKQTRDIVEKNFDSNNTMAISIWNAYKNEE